MTAAQPDSVPMPSSLGAEDLQLKIVADEATPLYLQIVHQVKQLIMTHRLADGAQLPAVRRLASHLGVNPGTIVQAYRQLATEGLAESERGRGTMVRRLSGGTEDLLARDQLLDVAIEQLVTRSRALGFGASETRQRLSAQLLGAERSVPVVFLGVTPQQARRYCGELDTRFAGRGIRFCPYGLVDLLDRSAALIAELATAYTVITFVTQVPEVERELAAAGIKAEIIGVNAELARSSADRIRTMAADVRYTLVTEPRAVTTALAQLELDFALPHGAFAVLPSNPDGVVDPDRLAEVAAGDTTVVYSFGVRESVESSELPPERLLELRFELTTETLERLEQRWPAAQPAP